MMQV
jgi:hypothetical protein